MTQTVRDEGRTSPQTSILHSPHRADVALRRAMLLHFGLHYRCHCVKWVMFTTVLLCRQWTLSSRDWDHFLLCGDHCCMLFCCMFSLQVVGVGLGSARVRGPHWGASAALCHWDVVGWHWSKDALDSIVIICCLRWVCCSRNTTVRRHRKKQ